MSQPSEKSDIHRLLATMPQIGQVEWIGVRSQRLTPLEILSSVAVDVEDGLAGDRTYGGKSQKRQVTLIQLEHLELMSRIMQRDVTPEMCRRNIVVSGINLLALKKKAFRIGDVVMLGTGICAPCSRMETALGVGGYNAMLGHGGITAKVLLGGTISVGSDVRQQDV